MSLLVDTHILLRSAYQPEQLSPETARLLDDPDAIVWFSVASVWEVTIKRALGRPDFTVDPRHLREGLLRHRRREPAATGEHALAAGDLPPLHKDPFDRLLLAQARVEGLTLLTADERVAASWGKGETGVGSRKARQERRST